MTSRDFCYWLQGFFELRDAGSQVMTPAQTEMVRRHLALVFKHEIDPSMGSTEHQAELNETHSPEPYKPPHPFTGFHPSSDTRIRC